LIRSSALLFGRLALSPLQLLLQLVRSTEPSEAAEEVERSGTIDARLRGALLVGVVDWPTPVELDVDGPAIAEGASGDDWGVWQDCLANVAPDAVADGCESLEETESIIVDLLVELPVWSRRHGVVVLKKRSATGNTRVSGCVARTKRIFRQCFQF